MSYLPFLLLTLTPTLIIPQPLPAEPEKPSGTATIMFKLATDNELLLAPLKIGTPPQEVNVILDIASERTWIHMNTFKSSQSSSYSSENQLDERVQDSFSYRGYRSKETFILENKTLENFLFLQVDQVQNNNKFNGVLSLGREYDSKYYSIVYRLSSEMTTFYNSFVLKFNSSTKIDGAMLRLNESHDACIDGRA